MAKFTILECVCLLALSPALFTFVYALPWKDCYPVVIQDGFHVLNCSGKDLMTLPDQPLANIEVIDFSHNIFDELPSVMDSSSCPDSTDCSAFAPDQHCIQHLNFSRNDITEFHEHALHNLRCLHTLDLSFNKLTQDALTSTNFQEGVYRVRILTLRGNPLGALPDNVITEPFMPSLEHLDISQCQLSEFGEDAVDGFPELRILNISHNNLSTLHPKSFKGLVKLNILDLRHNQLTHLPEMIFADLYSLNLLQLSNNLVHSFHSKAFFDDSKLQTLELDNNQLTAVPYTAVDKLPKLKLLDLSYNPIAKVKRGEAVSSVTTLHLNHLHKLTSLDKDALASFPSLVNLSIRGNPRLETIHPLMLADNSSALTYLDLQSNKLFTLPADAVPYQQLKSLELSGNPWLCDDRLAWMITAKSVKPNTARCQEPPRLKGVFIKSLHPRQLQRYVPIEPLSAVIGFCVSLPLVCILCYLVWQRRRYCSCITIQGRYVSVYTRDMNGGGDSRVSFDLIPNVNRLKSVSNGGADDTKPFINVEEQPNRSDDDEEL